ncbi:Zn(2)-C6 fungal-type domain-containing protein [Fusarium sp. Ph1]|nr:Zn(2)-C6 fungal-type domain-containing protein [Fusarium sp. Ph1]
MDDPEPTNASQEPRITRKRKRTAHACEPCRQRKSRCDGSRPVCDLCDEHRVECYYRDSVAVSASKVDHHAVARLDTRLRDMERLLHRLVPACSREPIPSPPSLAQNETQEEVTHPSSVETQGHDAMPQDGTHVDLASGTDSSVWSTDPNDSVDGMASITFQGETCSGVFGPTSNPAFLQKIIVAQRVIFGQGQHRVPSLNPFHAAASLDISRPASPPPAPIGAYSLPAVNPHILPSHHDVLQMVDTFFENTGKFFPYLYKPWILRSFANMRRSGFQNVERSQLCILNLLMAFATTHCPSDLPVSLRAEQGDVFLQRALLLIPDIKPATGNLEPIQALLMATQYIQGTQRSSQTWDILGRLIHAAFQVGLYQPASQAHYSPLEAELRKRAWWMCFIMDRMCSMTYGRPQLVLNAYMVMDLPTDVELETLAGSVPDNMTASAASTPSLLVYTSRLYLILGQVIESVYDNNISCLAPTTSLHQILKRVLEVDQDLTKWRQQLPPGLSQVTASELSQLQAVGETQTYRFRTILTVRYLNVRTLLHRAVLSRLLESPSRQPHQDLIFNMSVSSMETCVETALESIGIISQATHQQYLLPIWWYSVYFTFTAALAIYGSILVINRGDIQAHRFAPADLVQALQTALQVLEQLGGETHQALRCKKIVHRLLQVAQALYVPVTNSQERETGICESEQVQLVSPNANLEQLNGDFIRGLDSDMMLDLSNFADGLGSLIPDMFPL